MFNLKEFHGKIIIGCGKNNNMKSINKISRTNKVRFNGNVVSLQEGNKILNNLLNSKHKVLKFKTWE